MNKKVKSEELVIANQEKKNRADELVIANEEKANREAELVIANEEKKERADELLIANIEKAKRADELVIAKADKAEREAELLIANEEKAERSADLIIANIEKAKRADELVIAKAEKAEREAELIIATEEKEKRSAELIIANIVAAKRAAELIIANVEKAKRAAELVIANKELGYQNTEKEKRSAELIIADVKKTKLAAELVIANVEKAKLETEFIITSRRLLLAKDKERIAKNLVIANKELTLQNSEKQKRANELIIANKELAIQNSEKQKRADELIIANKELAIQNSEKQKRADELIIANKELAIQNEDKLKRVNELIIAKTKAEESDRLKSAFLTNMSHEIRTPMNGILGFAEIIKEPTISSDDLQDYIQIIQISGARMLNTINNIVDISKIESGLIHVDIKETNINEKIEFTYNFFKPEAENKQLQLSYKIGLQSKEAIINTDNEKVYSILTNLVKNAIKFTYEGSIEFGYEKKGEYLEFFVKDTGIGIKQNQREIIFERFRQGSESHTRGYEGSGLGLSIAKSYVEMLGGKIWVVSEEGIGSTFYFTIPYNALSEAKTVVESIFSEKYKEFQLKKLKILIVEDDEISHSLLTRILQSINCEVFHAITGIEAVKACRTNPDLDLVLMDIRMPNMDGHEATRQIRQFNKDVIIIAQTAFAFSGDKEKAIEAGCNSYITKPINKTLLFELIHKHLNK